MEILGTVNGAVFNKLIIFMLREVLAQVLEFIADDVVSTSVWSETLMGKCASPKNRGAQLHLQASAIFRALLDLGDDEENVAALRKSKR